MIATIDVETLQATRVSPAMPIVPATVFSMSPSYYVPIPFAVDSSGMILGIQYHGIAFDDPTPKMNYAPDTPPSPPNMQHMTPYSGPLKGGTTSSGFGNWFEVAPDVYYGTTQGTVTMADNMVSITSPATSTPGPVDVKMLFPDGNEVFDPQFFTYGTQIQDAVISGGSPQGGTAAQLAAFGLPLDPSLNTVTVGGDTATVTSTVTQYPPYTGEQTAFFLSYKTPSGTPGWADLTVTTPNGTGTLPKSFLFAKSVTDYPTADSPTFALYDKGRDKVYLSAGNHIDVFSLSSLSFSAALNSPVSGSIFQGLALTPDGKTLLAADQTNGGVAVIDPDLPSGSYEIPLPGSTLPDGGCVSGPLFVAADNQGNAYITYGAAVGPISCGPRTDSVYIANITTRTGTSFNPSSCGWWGTKAAFVDASRDGSLIALAPALNIYSTAQQACIPVGMPMGQNSLTVAGDGNVIGLERDFVDGSGFGMGRFADPLLFYPEASFFTYDSFTPFSAIVSGKPASQSPRLNDAGSLYYWAFPNFIDVTDVQHGTLALRFGLTETVTNTVAPMAIDSSGQRIFLITDKGLTVVDLGNAPLAVGHLSLNSASPGMQIVIRGSGFENGITATVGGVLSPVTLTDTETLTLTVPAVSAGLQDLVLSNPDGKTYTLQNGIMVP